MPNCREVLCGQVAFLCGIRALHHKWARLHRRRLLRKILFAQSCDAAELAQRIAVVREHDAKEAATLRDRWRKGLAARYSTVHADVPARRVVVDEAAGLLVVGTSSGALLSYTFGQSRVNGSDSQFRCVLKRTLMHGSLAPAEICSLDIEGRIVVSGFLDGSAQLHDAEHGVCLFDHTFQTEPPRAGNPAPILPVLVKISERVVTIAAGNMVEQYSICYNGDDLPVIQKRASCTLEPWLCASSLTAVGSEVWLGTKNGLVVGLDEKLRVVAKVCPHARQPITALCMQKPAEEQDHDLGCIPSRVIFSGSVDGKITCCIFVPSVNGNMSLQLAHSWKYEHHGPVVALQADEHKLVSGALDGTIQGWDVGTGQVWWSLKNHTQDLGSVQFGKNWLIADGTGNDIILADFSKVNGI